MTFPSVFFFVMALLCTIDAVRADDGDNFERYMAAIYLGLALGFL